MRRMRGARIFLALVALAVAAAAVADEAPARLRDLPPLLRAVSDEPGVLSLAEGRALSRRIAEIEHDTGVKLAAAVVATVAPESVEAYVLRLINHWKRHSRALDSDRFVFVVVSKNDREVRVVPGPDLAWVLKSFSKRGMTENVPTLLRMDQYYEALLAIVNNISRIIADRRRTVRLEEAPQESKRHPLSLRPASGTAIRGGIEGDGMSASGRVRTTIPPVNT